MKKAALSRGERFKDARIVYNQHGHQTMAQVHKATGVSASLIQELEDDSSRDFGYCKIVKLAEHYGVSIDWLLGLAPAITVDPEIQGVCKYTGLSESSIKYLHFKHANHDSDVARLIDSVLFSSDCDTFDSDLLDLLGEILCSGSHVDNSILGVMLYVKDAQSAYKKAQQWSFEKRRAFLETLDIKSAQEAGYMFIYPEMAYLHHIELAVAAFRRIITAMVEKKR